MDEAKERVLAALDERADEVINKYMWAAGGAAAINPFPLLDLAGGSAITVKMVLDLAGVYQQQIDADTIVTLLGQLGKNLIAMVGASAAAPALAAAIGSLLKTVPGIGTIAGGVDARTGAGAGDALDRPRVLRILPQRDAAAAGRPGRAGPPRMGGSDAARAAPEIDSIGPRAAGKGSTIDVYGLERMKTRIATQLAAHRTPYASPVLRSTTTKRRWPRSASAIEQFSRLQSREERALAAARSRSVARDGREAGGGQGRDRRVRRDQHRQIGADQRARGEAVAEVNVRGGWTKDVWNVGWDGAGYCVPGLADSQVVLIDTPGLNEVDGAQRAAMAHEAAARADLVLFVTDSDLNEVEYSALVELAASHKPILLVLNKADLYTPQELAELMSVFHGPAAGRASSIRKTSSRRRPIRGRWNTTSNRPTAARGRNGASRTPDVAALRERILEVLAAEGKALVALNAAMYAADKSDRMGALRVRMRNEKATATIWSFAVMKALGVASNPLAVADVVGGTAVDATMVVTLGKVYGIEITTANARELITSILKAAGWVMLSEAAVSYASSFFKAVTGGWGTVLTALPQGAAAGYGSYIVGQAARYYFEHGASWGQQGPKRVVTRILENTDKQSVLQRLKEEIKKKISLNRYAGK